MNVLLLTGQIVGDFSLAYAENTEAKHQTLATAHGGRGQFAEPPQANTNSKGRQAEEHIPNHGIMIPDFEKTKPQLIAEIQSLREQAALLTQTQHLYRGLFDEIADGVIVHSPEGEILDVNATTIKRLGYTADDLRTMHIRDIVSPEFMPEIGRHVGEVLAGKLVVYETSYLALTGRHVTCEVAERAVDYQGRPALLSVSRDITGRKWTPQQIVESEEKYKTIFEDSLEAMSLIQDGKIIDVNMAWVQLHGYDSKDEVVGMDVMSLVHREDKSAVAKRRKSSNVEPKRIHCVRDLKKDGTVIDVELYSSSLTVDGKDAIITTVRDITERKRIERERDQLVRLLSEYNVSLEKMNTELGRSNRELQDFAHVVSHDLQEPLRMVTGYLQLLAQRHIGKLDSEAREFIEYAVDGAHGMHRLITDLLEYAQVDTSQKTFDPIDLERVLSQALANLRTAVSESDAIVTHDPLPTIMGDELQFVQIFQNLIGNAIKFRSAALPRINVSATRKKDVWLFSVQDNGIGIDPDFAQRIFTIFQRLHSKTKYPGSGIGLSICKKIVERHGGQIWVESALGSGSTFYLTVPFKEKEKPKPQKAQTGALQVLVVDDNEADVRLLKETLKDPKASISLTWVEDGVEAMDFLNRRDKYAAVPRPNLILLDLNMPKKDGHEVLAEIKASEQLRDIPVAIITTSRDKQDIIKSGSLQATWYVTKPVDIFQVLELLDTITGNAQSASSAEGPGTPATPKS